LFKSIVLDAPEITEYGAAERAEHFKYKDHNDHFVDHDLNVACFGACLVPTHHYCRFLTAVTCHTNHPFSVFQLTPSV
jgi:hypothetical protein